ncbi:Hpt domain-containing protein [Sphingomonas sp. R647]|uniref:Hpt domain-containing protein n=1 Tax=Sphingomonas sp. R647 TaxID=2875233 RepID=UPI001CD3FEE8|nr:Hpt domain-containing protein [Sphingomonas sp. R647]MCA1196438.1 Hpt domain-containing protein [Sphingomonas sp. R647]
MDEFEVRMAALRARFVARAIAEGDSIRSHLAQRELAEVRDLCHGLVGTAGTFGYPAISEAALAVEEAIEAGAEDDALEALCAPLMQQLEALRQGR